MGKSIILIRGFLYICTVVLEVPKPRMADAFSVLRDLKLPVNGYAMDIVLLSSLPFVKSSLLFLVITM